MISKNGCDWFHWDLTCFALKMAFLWKMLKRDELCDFRDFVVFSWWNVHVYSTALICDLSVYIVEALKFFCLVLIQLPQLILSGKTIGELCWRWPLRLLWLVWYDYMKMYERLIDFGYDVYLSMMNFLLYLNCEKMYRVVDL